MLRQLSIVLAWPFQVFEHRRVLAQLGSMDERELADIGLNRQDLRDVTALPLGVDPSRALAQRAAEREFLATRARRPRRPTRMAAE
jgi:uncharacterized protein YjiS (DUF1127 family)